MAIFGDSLSDDGNSHILFPDRAAAPYYQGRFSNGPVWVDRLASDLGLPAPVASLAKGTNFAYGGAETGFGSSPRGTPNIDEQIKTYLKTHKPDTGTLIVLWGGSNDVVYDNRTMPVAVANLSREIKTLSAAGGTTFLVPNLPEWGDAPNWQQDRAYMNNCSEQFNALLTPELDHLDATLGIRIFRLDAFGLTQQMRFNPKAFGLTNVTGRALTFGQEGEPVVVSKPDQYMYWDGAHFTSTVNRYIGDQAYAILPEPAAIWAIGLIGHRRVSAMETVRHRGCAQIFGSRSKGMKCHAEHTMAVSFRHESTQSDIIMSARGTAFHGITGGTCNCPARGRHGAWRYAAARPAERSARGSSREARIAGQAPARRATAMMIPTPSQMIGQGISMGGL
jgi:phospholipase/lecithinase/hemolysin